MNIRNFIVLASALLGIGLSTGTHAAQTPNFFDCTGKNVSLTLSVGGKAEAGFGPTQTTLNLKVGKKNYTFQEPNITTESTLLGDLWEVTLNFIPDLHIDHASVVIPNISLGNSPIAFKSQLILTRVETPFVATVYEGVVNSSKYIDISCTASTVY